jgi:hypothetical protein
MKECPSQREGVHSEFALLTFPPDRMLRGLLRAVDTDPLTAGIHVTYHEDLGSEFDHPQMDVQHQAPGALALVPHTALVILLAKNANGFAVPLAALPTQQPTAPAVPPKHAGLAARDGLSS